MLLEIFLAIIAGCIAGTITGITPGVHINLVSLLVLTASGFLLSFTSPIIIAIFIAAMAITHTFVDFIPSCFLGAPESDTALSVLPAHKYLLKGRGYEAVFLTVVGSLLSLFITIALIPILIFTVNKIYPILRDYIGYILLISVLFLILKERHSRIWAFITFLISGVLGLAVFNFSLLKDPLFPMLSGLFGISILLISLKDNTKIPKQKITTPYIDNKTNVKALSASVVTGSLCSFLPGLGPAQAAIIASSFTRKLGSAGFLIIVGALNTVNMILSFVTLYTINKARNGAIVIMSKIIESFNLNYLILIIGCILVVAFFATLISLNLAKLFSKFMTKVNYKKLCIGIISVVVGLVILLTGLSGLLVLIVSTLTGLIPTLNGVGKNHLMGCLLLPVILFFLL